MNELHVCPVCGYPGLLEPPRLPVGGGASNEICPSCGFEFGYDDEALGHTYDSFRDEWRANGMRWWAAAFEPPPEGWNPQAQLDALLGQAP